MKVSVIMGIYNPVSKEETSVSINSILSQRMEDIELILCDDGSSEKTKAWLREIISDNPKIKLITNSSNRGLAYSLNRCLEIAEGKYIARQDADDYSDEYRLEKEYEFLEKNPGYSLVGSNIYLYDDKGVYDIFKFPEIPDKKHFKFASPFNHGSIMVKKSVLEEMNGYRVCEETLRCEDYDLFLRMYIAGHGMYNLQEPLYYFKEDESSQKRRNLKDRYYQCKVRARYFKKMGIGFERYLYISKPLIVGILPVKFIGILKNYYYKKHSWEG